MLAAFAPTFDTLPEPDEELVLALESTDSADVVEDEEEEEVLVAFADFASLVSWYELRSSAEPSQLCWITLRMPWSEMFAIAFANSVFKVVFELATPTQ